MGKPENNAFSPAMERTMLRQRTAEVRGLSVWHLAAKPFANKIVGLQHPPAVSKPQVNLEAFF